MGRRCIIVEAECLRETDKAILVQLEDESNERWIPKSALSDDSEVYEVGDEGNLIIHNWFAEKEGIEGDPYEE